MVLRPPPTALRPVAVGNQDDRAVPMPAAVLLGGLDEPLGPPVPSNIPHCVGQLLHLLRLEQPYEGVGFPWK
jgi:hypothetical protein